MASLQILTGDRRGQAIDLSRDTLTMGRSQDNDVPLDDGRLSRHHARLERQGNVWLIEDLNSANGTFIERGGRPLRVSAPTPLSEGDVIVLGSWRAGVSLAAAPEEHTIVAQPPPAPAPPVSQAPPPVFSAPPEPAAEAEGDFERTRVLETGPSYAYQPASGPAEELVPASGPGLRPANVHTARRLGHRLLGTLVFMIPALVLALIALYITLFQGKPYSSNGRLTPAPTPTAYYRTMLDNRVS